MELKPEAFLDDCSIRMDSWSSLKKQLRYKLELLVGTVMEEFETVSRLKVDSAGSENTDPSVFTGSSGLVFAMFRYSLLLNNEMSPDDE
jgi:hypothetical protein